MELLNKYIIACALLFVIVPVVLSTMTGEITATDWIYRHRLWIDEYLSGDFSRLLSYPPLFHWLLMPLADVNFPMQWLQPIFAIMTTFSILSMTYKLEGEKTAVYLSVLLASSIAYVGFCSALMPQALDYFLFPFMILFYSQGRVKESIILGLVIFFMHGTGFIFLGILFGHSLLMKRYKRAKIYLAVMLILLPIFIWYSFIAVPFDFDAQAQIDAEKKYTEPFWNFFFFSGFMTWFLLAYIIYEKIKGYRNYRKTIESISNGSIENLLGHYKDLYKSIDTYLFTEAQLFYIIWILAFVPLYFFQMGLWRMISYQIVPLSLLVASMVKKE